MALAKHSPIYRPSETYLDLVRAFPLVPLRDQAHLDAAIEVVDELIDRAELSADEQAYLDVLADLVERYEHERIELPEARGVDVLRHLMEEHELRQADLAPLFGSRSIVSEVLSGKRGLSLSHITRLSRHFGVPADVFLDS